MPPKPGSRSGSKTPKGGPPASGVAGRRRAQAEKTRKQKLAYDLFRRQMTITAIAASKDPVTHEPLYDDVSWCGKMIREYTSMLTKEDGQALAEARYASVDQLRQMAQEAALIARRPHPLVDRAGRVVMVPRDQTRPEGPDNPLVAGNDDSVTIAALRELRMLNNSIASRLGLNAPVQVEHSGRVEFDLPTAAAELITMVESDKKLRVVPDQPLALPAADA